MQYRFSGVFGGCHVRMYSGVMWQRRTNVATSNVEFKYGIECAKVSGRFGGLSRTYCGVFVACLPMCMHLVFGEARFGFICGLAWNAARYRWVSMMGFCEEDRTLFGLWPSRFT